MITEDDVRAGLDTRGDEGGGGESEAGEAGEGEDEGDAATKPAVTVAEARELSGVQRTLSDRLSESDREAVHVTLNRSIDDRALRAVADAADAAPSAPSVSLTDLLIKGVAEALSAHPEFNAHFEDGEHRLIEEVNVGLVGRLHQQRDEFGGIHDEHVGVPVSESPVKCSDHLPRRGSELFALAGQLRQRIGRQFVPRL